MVGPYIPVTEQEILKPWPVGGFQLADCPTASGETKSSAKRKMPPKARKHPKKVRGLRRKTIPSREGSQVTTPT